MRAFIMLSCERCWIAHDTGDTTMYPWQIITADDPARLAIGAYACVHSLAGDATIGERTGNGVDRVTATVVGHHLGPFASVGHAKLACEALVDVVKHLRMHNDWTPQSMVDQVRAWSSAPFDPDATSHPALKLRVVDALAVGVTVDTIERIIETTASARGK